MAASSSSTTPFDNLHVIWKDGDYEFLLEFNFDDMRFQDLETLDTFALLSPVTDSQSPSRGGLCSFYSINDCHHTRRIILEATKKESRYPGNRFLDAPSVMHLADSGKKTMNDLVEMLVSEGGISEEEYMKVPKIAAAPYSGMRYQSLDLEGCTRFKADDKKIFIGQDLIVTPEEMLLAFNSSDGIDKLPGKAIGEVRKFGPVVGVYDVTKDNKSMCDQPIYETRGSKALKTRRYGISGILAHGVMIVGFGLARHVPSRRLISYYVIQNNWGVGSVAKPEIAIGRLPCTRFSDAYALRFNDQCDLRDFEKVGGNGRICLIRTELKKTNFCKEMIDYDEAAEELFDLPGTSGGADLSDEDLSDEYFESLYMFHNEEEAVGEPLLDLYFES